MVTAVRAGTIDVSPLPKRKERPYQFRNRRHDGCAPMTATTEHASAARRRVPVRYLFGGVVLAVAGWFLYIYDSAGDNDIVEGFRTLADGFGRVPSLVSDTSGISSLWRFIFEREGLFSAPETSSNPPVITHVYDHITLVLTSMLVAVVVAVILGVIAHRVKALSALIVGTSSVLLTIPSLALFAIFLTIVGTGDRGPLIALGLYSLLPILRNTVTGLDDVDSAVVESAKGVGLSPFQRLTKIELPMAWPVILTGIRVATLLNIGIAAIAPLVGGTGLGYYINAGLNDYPAANTVERMWTGVVFAILLALLFDLGFWLVRRLTTPKGIR